MNIFFALTHPSGGVCDVYWEALRIFVNQLSKASKWIIMFEMRFQQNALVRSFSEHFEISRIAMDSSTTRITPARGDSTFAGI